MYFVNHCYELLATITQGLQIDKPHSDPLRYCQKYVKLGRRKKIVEKA